jgi:hypothetical protein
MPRDQPTHKLTRQDFVNSDNGDRFQIIGVDYQPGGSSGFTAKLDPLSDGKICMRDAALMQRLGVCGCAFFDAYQLLISYRSTLSVSTTLSPA